MESSITKKFRIGPGDHLKIFNAPPDFLEKMEPLPQRATVSGTTDPQQVHWFVNNVAQVEKEVQEVLSFVKNGVILWVYFPKRSSKMQSDLTRDKGWEALASYNLQFLNLVSFDETWSAFAMKKQAAKKNVSSGKKEEEFPDYIDPAKRIVKIPADLSAALEDHDILKQNFLNLAFTHKKEYVQWILSAKKEETRQTRIKGTIDKLAKGLKNPSDK
jgi:hypothetical protein